VGAFHRGGPIHDRADFSAFTQPGRVLDSKRLLVASSSNFGAPLARPAEAPGAILSIDPNGDPVDVPSDFATSGTQASTLGGRVQLYTAQSPAFLNSRFDPGAVTAALPAASLPLGISLNNGFGRPWLANTPNGSDGDGTITVLDPVGAPLAGAPDPVAGGVFAGDETNRNADTTHGLVAGALATNLVTKSPDGSGRAVFFAALADGSVVQVHVQRGVDGLVPPGTFTPIAGVTPDAAESADPDVVTRVGIAFNWVGQRRLFVSDPLANRILEIDLGDDGTMFTVTGTSFLESELFEAPVDITPSAREVASPNFSSGTTLGGGADMFVVNRGSNRIVRVTQDGEVLAARRVEADVPGFRLNGIAVSSDGQTLWLTATAPDRQGVLLSVPSFGAGRVVPTMVAAARAAGATDINGFGADFFSRDLQPDQGLGPLFNGQSCNSCHNDPFPGGMGSEADEREFRVAKIHRDGRFDPLLGHGGPLARNHSISELGARCGLQPGIPPQANATSLRIAMTLRGNGLIDAIQVRDVLANQALEPEAVRGRPNTLEDGRIGRFGWKAQIVTLVEFMGAANRDELGVTNPIQPRDLVHGCGQPGVDREIDALPLQAEALFLNTLEPPVPSAACLASSGATLFHSLGCAGCHTPSLPGPGRRANLFSDLLLHDMGPDLADGFPQGSATGSEFRTMPLWRASERTHFLHDSRATTFADAISAHGGQAAAARDAFQALDAASRQALLDFLGCI